MNLNRELLYWIFIGCILSVISIEIPDGLINQEIKECMDKLGYDKKKFSTMFDEKFHVIYPHEVTTNALECFLGKMNMFKEDGSFNRELVIKQFAKDLPKFLKDEIDAEKATSLANKLYNTCTGENSVHKIAIMHNCVMDKLEDMASS